MRFVSNVGTTGWKLLLLIALLASALVVGWCISTDRSGTGGGPAGGGPAGNGGEDGPELLSSSEVARVEAVCSSCHMLPDPAGLPRDRWRIAIPEMLAMPLPEGVEPLTPEDIQLAQRYYAERAPEMLDPLETATRSTGGLRFRVEHFTPQHDTFLTNRLATVSYLAFEPLHREDRLDLLICDFRSRTIFLQSPWATEEPQRQIRAQFREGMNYPSRINSTDLTGNGMTDFIVSSLGNMIPRNHEEGIVFGLLQTRRNHWEEVVLAENLARVTDARNADFNNNGRQDLVVCCFGWRGPGQLLLLENTSSDPFAPQYTHHQLDSRDGWIHAIPYDVEANGYQDILAIIAQDQQQVVWFRNKGNLEFEKIVLYEAPYPTWAFTGMSLVDIDGDGATDILVWNGDSLDDNIIKPYHGIGWLRNKGDGHEGAERFGDYERIAKLPGCMKAVAADMNNNGRMDIVAVSWIPQETRGPGGRPIEAPQRWEQKDLASVVWIEQTLRGWRKHTIERHRNLHPSLAVGDYNGNGLMDIAVGNYVWMRRDDQGEPRYRSDYVTLFTQQARD